LCLRQAPIMGMQQREMMPSMPFYHLSDPPVLPEALHRPVLAIGNFDGMHLGHRAVFDAARHLAETIGRPAAALTFEPHPRSFFAPGRPVFRLTPPAMKARLAERFGLTGLIDLTFDRDLAATDAETFVADTLVARLRISGLAVGYDFSFGKGRGGTAQFLADAGQRLGFPVSIVQQRSTGGTPVSSSEIRNALEAGDVPHANALLGHAYSILGKVVHGKKLGRTIGYPTANIALAPDTRLLQGIYAVRMWVGAERINGVASFGTRPTFDNGPPLLEVFLFDFDRDLYGQTVEVEFAAWLRPELKFDGVEPLVRQMDQDSDQARRILAG
jgi:riboflavin kinase / FMN adenylyltransferase